MRAGKRAGRPNGETLVDEIAAEWRARLMSDACAPEDRAAFEVWLAKDAAHARAYERLGDFWASIEPLKMSPVVRAALEAPARRIRARKRRLAQFAAGFSLAALAAAMFFVGSAAPDYQTATGEQRDIRLADGSTLRLNTQSEVDVRFSQTERRITLLRGEAGFDVARDPVRPFVVYAGPGVARATGTSFDIYKSEAGARVTLIEGSLQVTAAARARSGAPATLGPGEQVEVAANGTMSAVRTVALEKATAWRQGRIYFQDASLADAIDEANRYSKTRIVLADENLKSLRISGVFDAGRPEAIVRALEARFEVRVSERTSARITLESAPAP